MLPASRAAWVPVFMATPTSAWARAGASLVPSPIMAISLPPSCSLRMRASLSSGLAWAMKSSTPASAAMAAAVSWLSPVTMMVLDAHFAQLGEAFLDAALDDVLEMDDAEGLAAVRHQQRRGALARDFVHLVHQALSTWPPLSRQIGDGSAAPLRMQRIGWHPPTCAGGHRHGGGALADAAPVWSSRRRVCRSS